MKQRQGDPSTRAPAVNPLMMGMDSTDYVLKVVGNVKVSLAQNLRGAVSVTYVHSLEVANSLSRQPTNKDLSRQAISYDHSCLHMSQPCH